MCERFERSDITEIVAKSIVIGSFCQASGLKITGKIQNKRPPWTKV